jgi:hypothetical protein
MSRRDQADGSVWFWNHEDEADKGEAPSENNIEHKAADWQAFLGQLRPPGQPA